MVQQFLSVETVRLGSDTKTHLSTLKKRTGIENWNTLCRWAFCLSLSDEAPVRDRDEKGGAFEHRRGYSRWKRNFASAQSHVIGSRNIEIFFPSLKERDL